MSDARTSPIKNRPRLGVTLAAFGGEKNVFDQNSVIMLQNISFAMDRFDFERQRQQLQSQRAADAPHRTELSSIAVVVQEQERRRLAAELHDRTSPNLCAVALNLAMIAADLPANLSEGLDARFADTRALLDDTIAAIRDVCAELRPATLEYAGLHHALREHAERFSRRTGIAVQVFGTDSKRRLTADTECSLFRIAQEALTNCAKHARATAINIELTDGTDQTVLSISDNGAGFSASALGSEHRPGLGLLTMRERAEFVGGQFSIEGKPGKGTRIRVKIGAVRDNEAPGI